MRANLVWATLMVILIMAAVPTELSAARRALLIGINDYLYGPEDWDLRGCVNDVQMTRRMLHNRFGFPEENIKVLLDREATARNIVAAIEDWLIARTAPEDIVYFHFSGHGSRISDRDGDEDDGWDEMLCPVDLVANDIRTMVIDDELGRLLDRIPARNVTVVLDACHSGTGTRDMSLSRPRFINLEEALATGKGSARTRGLGTPSDPQAIVASFQSGGITATPGQGMETGRTGRQSRVTISGCKPDQTSADAWIRDGLYAGAFTFNLLQNVERAPSAITYRELLDRVRRDMAGKFYQTPQIEGDIDLPVLQADLPEASMASVATPDAIVESVSGATVRLNIGWAHGVTPGSVYAVYPASAAISGPGAARVQVDMVGDTVCEASIIQGYGVEPGARVKQVLHSFNPERLNVLLEAPEPSLREELELGLARVSFIELVSPDRHFDLRLRVGRESGLIRGALVFDGVPRAVETAAHPDGLVEGLRPHLSGAFVAKRLSSLSNPAPEFEVSVWANRVSAAGYASDPQSLDESPGERLVQARIGDVVRLNFRAERNCYLTVINVDATGFVTVLFPNKYRPDGWINGGRVYQTETEGEMPFKIRAVGPPGRELVKAVATLEPLDPASLQMGTLGASGTRSIASGGEFTEQLARGVAAVPVAGGGASAAPAAASTAGPLLPTSGWATDYLIIDTRE